MSVDLETERFIRVFAVRHSAEMQAYYGPRPFPCFTPLSCRLLEAQAPERGVYSVEAGTWVNYRKALVLARGGVGRKPHDLSTQRPNARSRRGGNPAGGSGTVRPSRRGRGHRGGAAAGLRSAERAG